MECNSRYFASHSLGRPFLLYRLGVDFPNDVPKDCHQHRQDSDPEDQPSEVESPETIHAAKATAPKGKFWRHFAATLPVLCPFDGVESSKRTSQLIKSLELGSFPRWIAPISDGPWVRCVGQASDA